jgi:hypothetical protein
MKRLLLFALLAAGCGSSGKNGFTPDDAGQGDATISASDGGGDDGSLLGQTEAGTPPDCAPTSQNREGCGCSTSGASQPCYTGDPKTRGKGQCKDGAQTCEKRGEFSAWGTCTGAVVPSNEACTAGIDTNCNGKTGCDDPACATDPACNTGCTDGQTRPCYDGPAGTENVGTCKDGVQTCLNGQWPATCTGEVLPQQENCCDALDHNCNLAPGCLDLFACALAQCCQTQCQPTLDPGCVCPQGSGDTETCPAGDHVIHKGGFPGTDECCPCAAADCSDPNCCGNAVCAGASACSGTTCKPLPASCNGQVSADCDDFPEDCDEPCCLCTSGCP